MKVASVVFYWTTAAPEGIPGDKAIQQFLGEHSIKYESKTYDPWLIYNRTGYTSPRLPCIVLRDADGNDIDVIGAHGEMTPEKALEWIKSHVVYVG